MIDNFKVVVGEVDLAIDIMREVAQWCQDAGLKMWNPKNLTRDRLMEGLKEEDFCVGKIGSDSACCMILQWYDPVFWPSAKENESGYIHKFCVKREYSGIGLSKKMVEYAILECKKRGAHYLRLDTGLGRAKLCRHYESLGFEMVGKCTVREYEYALYEIKL